ncbi:fumarylacetoacetate hydrolase family protein [Nocardia rhamnosiphila]|uniref:fumarylacetoacetate hydrolase family protein n=1 Tax=Nocardia rhamnosiphila TaxID=426716 RepID=UPI0033CF516F
MQIARQRVDGPDGISERILVRTTGTEAWFDVRAAARLRALERGATPAGARRLAQTLVPSSMSDALSLGQAFHETVRDALEAARENTVVHDPRLTNALDPTSYRDFMVFQEHFSFGYRWQNKPVPDVMYELPVSYAGDPLSFLGPGDPIPWPPYTERLDYELELGIVIGTPGINLTPDEALDHVLGLTILNDVSARDIQAKEMTGGLGPSKGKHFACVTGPVITTLDDIPADGLSVRAQVNGDTWCETTTAQMVWSVAEIVAWASQGEMLRPGALLGSGTCNGGSTIEVGRTLAPGDRLELEIDKLGALHNTLGAPDGKAWVPDARPRGADGTTDDLHFLR